MFLWLDKTTPAYFTRTRKDCQLCGFLSKLQTVFLSSNLCKEETLGQTCEMVLLAVDWGVI